jgi:hypothetical protein
MKKKLVFLFNGSGERVEGEGIGRKIFSRKKFSDDRHQ